mmetsp:Transcript_49642/g.131247  ORF Transcript_49642/g.131247 Transcript_49642/m.131247 type:complete len:262 (+) Transcript_49642:348-1133(+)
MMAICPCIWSKNVGAMMSTLCIRSEFWQHLISSAPTESPSRTRPSGDAASHGSSRQTHSPVSLTEKAWRDASSLPRSCMPTYACRARSSLAIPKRLGLVRRSGCTSISVMSCSQLVAASPRQPSSDTAAMALLKRDAVRRCFRCLIHSGEAFPVLRRCGQPQIRATSASETSRRNSHCREALLSGASSSSSRWRAPWHRAVDSPRSAKTASAVSTPSTIKAAANAASGAIQPTSHQDNWLARADWSAGRTASWLASQLPAS